VGFTSSLSLLRDWWSLTPPFQPCLKSAEANPSAVYFLLHFPYLKRFLLLGGTLFCGARTFLSEFQSNHSIISDYQKTGKIKRVIQKIQVRNINFVYFIK
tara:strand:+ start:7034 stop:7333 length:300 start_codon:yes stop_codon:yes gene_type:complete